MRESTVFLGQIRKKRGSLFLSLGLPQQVDPISPLLLSLHALSIPSSFLFAWFLRPRRAIMDLLVESWLFFGDLSLSELWDT